MRLPRNSLPEPEGVNPGKEHPGAFKCAVAQRANFQLMASLPLAAAHNFRQNILTAEIFRAQLATEIVAGFKCMLNIWPPAIEFYCNCGSLI